MAEHEPIVLPEETPPAQAAAELKEMLETVAWEIASLDLLRRTLLSKIIQQRSGMSVEDWLKAAESLDILMKALSRSGRIEDTGRRYRILSMLTQWRGKLERLADCFSMAAQEASCFVKDREKLAGSLTALAYREQVIHRMIGEIKQLASS
ncbi:MAG: hypothetical protein ABSC17_10945 [Thermacetogeniaceae bacterium]